MPNSFRSNKVSLYLLPITILIFGLLGTFFITHEFREHLNAEIQDNFDSDSHIIRDKIQKEIDLGIKDIISLKAYFDSSQFVDMQEFHTFSTHMMKSTNLIQALEWVPRILLEDRVSFEKNMRQNGFPSFSITQRDRYGNLIAAPESKEYYPVAYVEPYEPNHLAHGFDLFSNTSRREALELSRDKAEIVVTSKIRLVQNEDESIAFLVFAPVFDEQKNNSSVSKRRENIKGFTLGVFSIDKILSQAFKNSIINLDNQIHFSIFDVSDDQLRSEVLYQSPGFSEKFEYNSLMEWESKNVYYEENIQVPGRLWKFVSVPSDGYFTSVNSSLPKSTLILGIIISFLLSVLMLLILLSRRRAFIISELNKNLDYKVQSRTQALEDSISELKDQRLAVISLMQDSRELAEREKRRSLELSKSEAKIKAIIDTAVDGIISIDSRGKMISINGSAQKMFGYSEQELIGKNINTLMPNPYRDQHDQYIKNYKQTGVKKIIGSNREVRAQRKNGETFPISLSIGEVRLDDYLSFTGVIRDISEQKRNEEDLKRSNKELEQFAYVASHDLQEPLRKIINFSKILVEDLKGKLDEDSEKYFNFMADAADRMRLLIKDLLDFSRSSQTKLLKEYVDFNQVIPLVLQDLELVINESKAQIIFDKLPTIYCAKRFIFQIFQNLIGNAIKFNRKGVDPVVEISCEKEDQFYHFKIKDNGIGIEEEYVEKIFEIFQRLHHKSEYPGTGIGLAICKRIIERHEGEIWIESEKGQGTIFHFTLPEIIVSTEATDKQKDDVMEFDQKFKVIR